MLNSLLISVGAIVGIVVVALVIILVIAVVVWWIKTANALVRLNNKAEEAWATIDVFLKKRYDLIPNLVETVKGYAKHESETLTNVVAARNAAGAAKTPEEKNAGGKRTQFFVESAAQRGAGSISRTESGRQLPRFAGTA